MEGNMSDTGTVKSESGNLNAKEEQREEERHTTERNEEQDLNQRMDTGTHDYTRGGVRRSGPILRSAARNCNDPPRLLAACRKTPPPLAVKNVLQTEGESRYTVSLKRPLFFGHQLRLNNAVMPEKAAFFHIYSTSRSYSW
jgi:hypothetical protein